MSLYEQNFFPEYKPLVFNTHLPKAAEVLRGRYDANMEAKSILDRAMGSVRTLNPIEQAKINQAKDEIEQKIAGRVDFENMGKIITDSTTRFLTDHRVLDAMDSYAVRQKEREMEDTLRVQGKTPLDFNAPVVLDQNGKAVIDPVTGQPMRRHKTEDWDSETKGIYRMAVEEKLPWDVKAAQLIQGIQSDTNMMQKAIMSGVDPGQVQYWLMQTSGVSKDKKDNIAKFLVDEFKSSSEGNQMFRDLTQLNVNPATGTVYTAQEAEDRMLNFLKDIGQKQVNTNYNYNQIAIPKSSGDENEPPRIEDSLLVRGETVDPFDGKLNDEAVNKYLKDKDFDITPSVAAPGTLAGNTGTTPAAQKVNRSKKVAELQKAYEQGNLYSVVTPETPKSAIFEFIGQNQDLKTAFPKSTNEDEGAYFKRLVGVFRDVHAPKNIRLNDMESARKLVAGVSLAGRNIFYDQQGNPKEDFIQGLWRPGDKAYEEALTHTESAVTKSFMESLSDKATMPAQIEHITTGNNAGRWRVRFMHDATTGLTPYETIMEPVANMGAYYAGMAALNNAAQSMKPTKPGQPPIEVTVAGRPVKMKLIPKTVDGVSKLVPMVNYIDMYNREVTSTLAEAESDLNAIMVQMYSQYNTLLGSAYRAYDQVREKKQ
jgi:hypothetical protein